MADPDGSTSGIHAAELLALAQGVDPSISERTLEYWRHQDLLPHGQRTGQAGKRPVWTYPRGTLEQLAALLRLRERTKDPNVLRAALWYDGYPIESALVRTSITTYLRKLLEVIEKELAKYGSESGSQEARWQAIQSAARVIAAKRGKGFPRVGRQALIERTRAVALTMGLVLSEEEAMRHLEADGASVERLIGVDRGRRFRPAGKGPWLDGPPEAGLMSFAQIGSLARLLSVVENATDHELIVARDLARTLLGGILAFSRFADAFVGHENAAGMAAMGVFDGDPHQALFVVPLVLSILGTGELAQNLHQVLAALQESVLPLEEQVKELRALSADERADRLKNLAALPFIEQVRIKRLLAQGE